MKQAKNKAYTKPKLIARSAARQVFVAGCPLWRGGLQYCTSLGIMCMICPLK